MGFMRGVGSKGPLSGVPHPPKIEPGYGPGPIISSDTKQQKFAQFLFLHYNMDHAG